MGGVVAAVGPQWLLGRPTMLARGLSGLLPVKRGGMWLSVAANA